VNLSHDKERYEATNMNFREDENPLAVDVAIVGGGPTGLIAAALLGRRHRVALIERQPARYSLPRAGHIDHEILRILQGLDAHQAIIDDELPLDICHWVNGDGETLIAFPWGKESVSGFLTDYMMFQPNLETGVYDAIERAAGKPFVAMGWEVFDVEQQTDGVLLTARPKDAGGQGETMSVRASYVLAADGAKSPMRKRLDISQHDYGFSERWLDVDVRIKKPLPQAAIDQQANIICDPSRPRLLGPLGRRHFRWEWMLFEDEKVEDFEKPEKAWELLAEWEVTPDHVEILRDVVYQFEAKIAEEWRRDRIFLLGDAAHTMPPHMGQGMCSGIRDAANLAWKLDLVLRGVAGETILDTYEEERRPHSDSWIQISMAVGEVSCTTDPVKAAVRDEALFGGQLPPMPDFPTLTGGLLQTNARAEVADLVGQLFRQAEVSANDRRGLFHDVFGQGFHLVSGAGDPRDVLTPQGQAILEELEATVSWIGDEAGGDGAFADPSGKYREYFADVAAVLVRPDYYVFGVVLDLADLPSLLDDCASQLQLGGAVSL
jgi:3-(3-hydroxy-phenyl)propionate hydroxylase